MKYHLNLQGEESASVDFVLLLTSQSLAPRSSMTT